MKGKLDSKKRYLKMFYSISAKMYSLDQMLWAAMHAPHDDIWFKSIESPDWKLILNNYVLHEIDTDEVLYESNIFFSKAFALGIAGLSKASSYRSDS